MKTAVEWLVESLIANECISVKEKNWNTYLWLIKTAKKTEKDNVIEGYCQGCADISNDESIFPREMAEQYYNKTFKPQEQ
jgi:hypothetical protein